LCGAIPPHSSISHSMSYESAARANSCYFDPTRNANPLPPPPCPFSPSSKSCFEPVVRKSFASTAVGRGAGQAIFRRQSSVAMSDTSWNDLEKVASVDEDDMSNCSYHSMVDNDNHHEAREDIIDIPNNTYYNQQLPNHSVNQHQLSFSYSNEQHEHSSIMPLPYEQRKQKNQALLDNSNNNVQEAFNCPISPQRKKITVSSVLTTSTQDHRDNKAITNAVFNWTKEDDETLIILMKRRRGPVKDWNAIARDHNKGKNGKECNERWVRYLKPGVKKGQWKPAEDIIVVKAVTSSNEQPFTKWSELSAKLPGRAGKQIRDRWVNYLNPAIHHLPFTREDDVKLQKGHAALGKRWAEISLKFFNGSRSENQIKNRWYSASFKKFIMKEYGNTTAYDKVGAPQQSSTSSSSPGPTSDK